nr:hypothetical protein [Bacteroidota bacterium]
MIKKLKLIILIAAIFLGGNIVGQDCNFYFPTDEGSVVEQTFYNKKGKPESVQIQKVLEKKDIPGGMAVVVEQTFKDSKGKNEDMKAEFELKCQDGKFFLNMDDFTKGMNLESYEESPEMEVTMDTDEIYFPSDMKPGDILPDASIKVSVATNGFTIMNMTINLKNRKVLAQESITVPAGTFDCFKVSFDTETKAIVKVKISTVQWLAEGVGMVKSENYDKRGNLDNYTEMTRLER